MVCCQYESHFEKPIMKITKAQKESVSLFESFAEKLASRVPKKTKSFFLALILGALLTIARRRTVTQWLKASQISDDFRQAFYHIPNIGRKRENLFDERQADQGAHHQRGRWHLGAADLDERGTLGEGNFGKLRCAVWDRGNVQGLERHLGLGQTGVVFAGVERVRNSSTAKPVLGTIRIADLPTRIVVTFYDTPSWSMNLTTL